MEPSPKAQTDTGLTQPASPCFKKKADEGLLANFKDHVDQFVHTSMDQHRICLKKTIQGFRDYVQLKKQHSMSRSSKVVTESGPEFKDAEGFPVL